MTIAEELERKRVDASAEGAMTKDPHLVIDRLQELYESLSGAEKKDADQAFVSWLSFEGDFNVDHRWHVGLSMVRLLNIRTAAPALLRLGDRFSDSDLPGSRMWAETVRQAASELSHNA